MTWGKVDDKLHMHPKVLDAGVDAMGLWVLALSHCCGYLTDGYVSEKIATRLVGNEETARALAGKLVEAGLWHDAEGGGWDFHDWAEYQPTAAQVVEERERKSSAGRAAGRASAQRRTQRLVNDSSTTRQRPVEQTVDDSFRGISTPVPSRPVPVLEDPPTPTASPDPVSEIRIKSAPVAEEQTATVPISLGAAIELQDDYAAAAAKAMGQEGFAFARYAHTEIQKAVNTHAPRGTTLAELRERIRFSVERFIDANPDPKFAGGYQPAAWGKWLNAKNAWTLGASRSPAAVQEHPKALRRADPAVTNESTVEGASALLAALAALEPVSAEPTDPEEVRRAV